MIAANEKLKKNVRRKVKQIKLLHPLLSKASTESELRPLFKMGLKFNESSLRGSLGVLNTRRVCRGLFHQ